VSGAVNGATFFFASFAVEKREFNRKGRKEKCPVPPRLWYNFPK